MSPFNYNEEGECLEVDQVKLREAFVDYLKGRGIYADPYDPELFFRYETEAVDWMTGE